jgi:hypothetical protein
MEVGVQNICRSYQSISGLKWSATLKHSDISIDGGTKAVRTDAVSRVAAVLSEFPLTRNCNWQLKIIKSIKIWVGIISGNYAKNIKFCDSNKKNSVLEQKMANLSIICSSGSTSVNSVKSGNPFEFGAGDMLTLLLNMNKLELTIEGKEGQKCILKVDELQDKHDRYYACAFLNNKDDSV